ncbi:MAG: hypothetical protein AB7K24_34855, partial [Gemmataceae bacterium]
MTSRTSSACSTGVIERGWRGLALLALTVACATALADGEPAKHKEPIEIHLDPAMLDQGLDLWRRASPEMKQKAVQLLRARLQELRGPAAEHMARLVDRREHAAEERIEVVMDDFAWCGLLLLLVPVLYRHRFPGRFITLTWSSLLAAGWFFITVHLFAVPLLLFFSFTMHLTERLDPRLYAVDPAFDVLDKNASVVLSYNLPIGPTLDEVQ